MRPTVYLSFIVIFSASLLFHCSKKEYSRKECSPVISKLMNTLAESEPPDRLDQLKLLEPSLVKMMEKECMSGNFDLKCLISVDNFESIQSCKK